MGKVGLKKLRPASWHATCLVKPHKSSLFFPLGNVPSSPNNQCQGIGSFGSGHRQTKEM